MFVYHPIVCVPPYCVCTALLLTVCVYPIALNCLRMYHLPPTLQIVVDPFLGDAEGRSWSTYNQETLVFKVVNKIIAPGRQQHR